MRILSIDFSIIMKECIKLYANKVNIYENPTAMWNILENEMEIDKHLSIDARILQTIVCILKKCKNAEFIPVPIQSEIVNDINNTNETVDIVNIDFFHDLLNVEDDITDWESKKYNELNWLGYLLYNEKVEKCTWIKVPNSVRCNNNVEDSVDIYNINEIPEDFDFNFDKVYFSLSPCFVPYKYSYIYDVICNFMTGENR